MDKIKILKARRNLLASRSKNNQNIIKKIDRKIKNLLTK